MRIGSGNLWRAVVSGLVATATIAASNDPTPLDLDTLHRNHRQITQAVQTQLRRVITAEPAAAGYLLRLTQMVAQGAVDLDPRRLVDEGGASPLFVRDLTQLCHGWLQALGSSLAAPPGPEGLRDIPLPNGDATFHFLESHARSPGPTEARYLKMFQGFLFDVGFVDGQTGGAGAEILAQTRFLDDPIAQVTRTTRALLERRSPTNDSTLGAVQRRVARRRDVRTRAMEAGIEPASLLEAYWAARLAGSSPRMLPTWLLAALGLIGLAGTWKAGRHMGRRDREALGATSSSSRPDDTLIRGEGPKAVDITPSASVGSPSLRAPTPDVSGPLPEPSPPLPFHGASPSPALLETLARRFGERYLTPIVVGSGGMGTVIRAQDAGLRRNVAIKVLPDRLASDPGFRERFLEEARILALFQHPAIPAVYDIVDGDEVDAPMFVMEYLAGQDLDVSLDRGELAPIEQVLTWICAAGEALSHAHAAGVIHRDIKPANLFLTSAGEIKVLDFGLARVRGHARMTQEGMILGTPQYMAPEVYHGGDAGSVADLYSLAATAFRLFTGHHAFSPTDRFRVHPAKATALRPQINLALERVLNRALDADPGARYPTIPAFTAAAASAVYFDGGPLPTG